MMSRTIEQQEALKTIQDAMRPYVEGGFLDELCVDLAGKSADEIDDGLRRVGHELFQLMKQTGPNLSEAVQIGLPFAFIEMARERIALMPASGAGQ
jgi:hypothetical protein